jgi:FKBP-type peptidyl-prolyl cis-trans isomerase FklB
MKSQWITAMVASISVTAATAHELPALETQNQKASYSIGVSIGSNLKQQGLPVDPELVAAGLRDALSGAETKLTQEQIMQTLMAFQNEMRAQQGQKAEKNKKEGEEFLAENKKKEGVTVLESGLQYKVIKQGTGEKPTRGDTVKAHYRGTFIDGSEFDSSYERGEPLSIDVTGVIPGWTEALQLMPVGSKWQLFIPSELAYGPQGSGPIGPNQTLVFDIELLEIEKE